MPYETNDLTGTVVAITGASAGIGRETARLLAEAGANVVLAARRTERLTALVEEMGPDRALAVPTDVRDPEQSRALVAAAVERFGRLDVLVANAGIGMYGGIEDASRRRPRAHARRQPRRHRVVGARRRAADAQAGRRRHRHRRQRRRPARRRERGCLRRHQARPGRPGRCAGPRAAPRGHPRHGAVPGRCEHRVRDRRRDAPRATRRSRSSSSRRTSRSRCARCWSSRAGCAAPCGRMWPMSVDLP